jgi:hypothetical protein
MKIKKSELTKECKDTNGVIRICKSKMDRQHNDKKKKDKRTNNDLQNIAQKTKDRVTRTPLKTGSRRCSGRVSRSCFTSGTCRVILVINPVIERREMRKEPDSFYNKWNIYIRSNLWHGCSLTVNQVMVATVTLSKWWFQL